MKKLFALLLVAGVLSCHKDDVSNQITIDPDPKLGPVQEATGTLSDYGAIDGCGLLLSIKQDSTVNDYAVSDSSTTLIKQYLVYSSGAATLKVIVRYQQTGRKKDVLCGWAGLRPFDEVLILSINPN